MIIAVTSEGPDLDSVVDKRFGRCQYVLLVESNDMSIQAIPNAYQDEPGGAGSRLAGLVASHNADLVLTGSLGPHALQSLEAAGIRAVLHCTGTVRQAIESHQSGHSSVEEQGFSSTIPLGSATQNRRMRRRHRGSSGNCRGRRGEKKRK